MIIFIAATLTDLQNSAFFFKHILSLNRNGNFHWVICEALTFNFSDKLISNNLLSNA